MKREDAYYYKILLMAGIEDGYDQWLDGFLENEDPLSEIVLNLSLCGSDVNATISCLHNFCAGETLDERAVVEKLRLFLKEAYHAGRMTKKETVSYMYSFAICHGGPRVFDCSIWGDMYYLDDYHSLAEDGIVYWDAFDSQFMAYLNDGIPIDPDKMWDSGKKGSRSFFQRIAQIFWKK